MVRFSLLAAIVLQLVAVSLQTEDSRLDIKLRLGESSYATVNDQINREYRAMYTYDIMTSYFGRPTVALPGFKKFFKKAADKKRDTAHKLIGYLNKRGGKVLMKAILPIIQPWIEREWTSAIEAAKQALTVELELTDNLYKLRDRADTEKDTQLVDFIESEFLSEQVNGISELRELVQKLDRAGSGLGEFMVDRELN